MKPPFDIAGDLDTPVSAFAKLGAFNPRFLLESVEGGERLARYSFIGFGKCLEVRLDAAGLKVGDAHAAAPGEPGRIVRRAAQGAGRARPSRCPKWPACRWPAAWSDIRRTTWCATSNACRRTRAPTTPVPDLHYVAPESMLVFDHLTRGIALLHAGIRGRAAVAAARGDPARCAAASPNYVIPGSGSAERYSPAVGSLSRDEYMAGVKRTQEYIAAGDVYQLVLSSRFSGRHSLDPFEAYRALRLINPSPYMYYCKLGDVTVVGSSPEALVKVNAAARRSCGRSPARGRAPTIPTWTCSTNRICSPT